MNAVQSFSFDESQIRTVVQDNEPWFVAKDVCDVLGFGNHRQAIASHVDTEDVQKLDALTDGGTQQITYINESGMYALIFGSKLESARRFKRWVTSEVLPQIRRTGSFAYDAMPDPLRIETAVKAANTAFRIGGREQAATVWNAFGLPEIKAEDLPVMSRGRAPEDKTMPERVAELIKKRKRITERDLSRAIPALKADERNVIIADLIAGGKIDRIDLNANKKAVRSSYQVRWLDENGNPTGRDKKEKIPRDRNKLAGVFNPGDEHDPAKRMRNVIFEAHTIRERALFRMFPELTEDEKRAIVDMEVRKGTVIRQRMHLPPGVKRVICLKWKGEQLDHPKPANQVIMKGRRRAIEEHLKSAGVATERELIRSIYGLGVAERDAILADLDAEGKVQRGSSKQKKRGRPSPIIVWKG